MGPRAPSLRGKRVYVSFCNIYGWAVVTFCAPTRGVFSASFTIVLKDIPLHFTFTRSQSFCGSGIPVVSLVLYGGRPCRLPFHLVGVISYVVHAMSAWGALVSPPIAKWATYSRIIISLPAMFSWQDRRNVLASHDAGIDMIVTMHRARFISTIDLGGNDKRVRQEHLGILYDAHETG